MELVYIAAAIMIGLGKRIEAMEPGLATLWLYSLHKSLGLAVLALVVLRLVWHHISPPPRPVGGGWQAGAARAVHGAIYLLLLAIPLSGWCRTLITPVWGVGIVQGRWHVGACGAASAARGCGVRRRAVGVWAWTAAAGTPSSALAWGGH